MMCPNCGQAVDARIAANWADVRAEVARRMVTDALGQDPSAVLEALREELDRHPELRGAWIRAAALDTQVVELVLKGAVDSGLYARRKEKRPRPPAE